MSLEACPGCQNHPMDCTCPETDKLGLQYFFANEHSGIPLYEGVTKETIQYGIAPDATFGARWDMLWGCDPGARQELYLKALIHGLELVPAGHVFEVRVEEFPSDYTHVDYGREKRPSDPECHWGVAWLYNVDQRDHERADLGLFMVSHVDKAVTLPRYCGCRLAARIRPPEVQK